MLDAWANGWRVGIRESYDSKGGSVHGAVGWVQEDGEGGSGLAGEGR